MQLRFGDFIFDAQARELRRAGRPLALSPKAFHLLTVLLESRPRALSKQELQDLLWPDTFTSHTSLPRVVTELRRALGDERQVRRFIRTVHGFGYAFCGEAAEEPLLDAPRPSPTTSCSVLWAGRQVDLAEGENLIGRTIRCTVRIDSKKVSRAHARILVSRGEASLEDLGSKNGTYVQGKRIEAATALVDGSEICVGPAVLVFVSEAGRGSTETGSGRNRR